MSLFSSLYIHKPNSERQFLIAVKRDDIQHVFTFAACTWFGMIVRWGIASIAILWDGRHQLQRISIYAIRSAICFEEHFSIYVECSTLEMRNWQKIRNKNCCPLEFVDKNCLQSLFQITVHCLIQIIFHIYWNKEQISVLE